MDPEVNVKNGHPLAPLTIPLPVHDTFALAVHQQPSCIDTLLPPRLLEPDLPNYLAALLEVHVKMCVTPEISWGGDPSRPKRYYLSCFVNATLLGRAYTLLSTPSERGTESGMEKTDITPFIQLPTELKLMIYEEHLATWQARQELWKAISPIFIKAFFSGPDTEPGARFAAGVLLLTCGNALSRTAGLVGHGKAWVWYNDEMEHPEQSWDWEDLKKELVNTKESLARENTDYKKLSWKDQYVPREVVEILDLAREHVCNGKEDLTSMEVVNIVLGSNILGDGEGGVVDLEEEAKGWKEELLASGYAR